MAKEETTKETKEETVVTNETQTPKTEETQRESEDPRDKRLAELEKKLGSVSDELGKNREYVAASTVVLTTIANDPELRSAFQNKFKQQYSGGEQTKDATSPENTNNGKSETSGFDRKVSDIEAERRDNLIQEFEKDHGIDRLPKEQREEVRKSIANTLGDFGWEVNTIPLTNLRSSLEKTYTLTHAEKLKEEGRLEGFAQARNNAYGTMGTISGTAPQTSQEADLTPKQREWIKKLGVDEEGAKKTYLSRDNEDKRVPPAEKSK